MKRSLLLLTLGATLLMVMACSSPSKARTATLLLHDVAPSVVRVYNAKGEGTGFVAFEVGSVLTAFHVVGDVDSMLTVVGADGTEHRAMVLGADEALDLALLSVPSLKAPPLRLGDAVATGDTVYAVGYAAGLAGEASVTQGILSGWRTESEDGVTYLQTDAPINPGNSGGPLLSIDGEVVGMNVAKLRGEEGEYEGMAFAISSGDIKDAYEALRAGEVRLLPTIAPVNVDAPSAYTVPDDWQELHCEGPLRFSLRFPSSWEVSHECPPIFGLPMDQTVVVVAFEPGIAWPPDMLPDDRLRIMVQALVGGLSKQGALSQVTGSSIYDGPQGPVYVIEWIASLGGQEFDACFVRYQRFLPDGRSVFLTYPRFFRAKITNEEHAVIRAVFDSIRVLEQ